MFQREMDTAFRKLIWKSVVIYLDDVIIYSKKSVVIYLYNLKQIFERCQKYDISPNPKKRIFDVSKGKLLGHIISKDGISLDLEKDNTFMCIPMPNNKKSLYSFSTR
jgi:hypothetical protein